MKEITFPYEVKRGSVSINIYRTPSHGCDSYTLSYYQDGARRRPTFPTFEKAKAEAERVAGRLAATDADVLTLSSADRAAYLRARQVLDPVGMPIEAAAAQLADAKSQLCDVPLSQAVEFYLKRHPTRIPPRAVADVVTEMLEAKEGDGLSAGYVQHLRYDLKKFAGAFRCNIGVVSGADVDTWLRGLGVSPRTRNNLRTAIQTLFSFAKARKYLPKDHDELDAVARAKDGEGEIEVFTPAELAEILTHAEERLILFLALGAFAGIRHAEIKRLDWRDIQFEEGIIEMQAKKAKTASRRIVPLLDNLRAWLLPRRRPGGPVCGCRNVAGEIDELARRINKARRAVWAKAKHVSEEDLKRADVRARKRRAEAKAQGKKCRGKLPAGAETAEDEGWKAFAWKHNALRHSFISYRVAETQDVAKVSLEAGNSPQMIFQHYRELVTEKSAKEWFSIVPGGEGKVIEMRKAA